MESGAVVYLFVCTNLYIEILYIFSGEEERGKRERVRKKKMGMIDMEEENRERGASL